jgi:hypothetical protein
MEEDTPQGHEYKYEVRYRVNGNTFFDYTYLDENGDTVTKEGVAPIWYTQFDTDNDNQMIYL